MGKERLPQPCPDGDPVHSHQTSTFRPPRRPWPNAHNTGIDSPIQVKAAPHGEKRASLSVLPVSSGGHYPIPPATGGLQGHLPLPTQLQIHSIFFHPHNRPHRPSKWKIFQNIGGIPRGQVHPPPGYVQSQ